MPRGLAASFRPPTLGGGVKVVAGHDPQKILGRSLESDPATSSLSSSSPIASFSSTLVDSLFPSATSSTPSVPPNRRPVSQTVLMWVFAVIALALLTILVVWRYAWMRLRNRRSTLQNLRGRTGGATRLSRSQSGRIVRDSDFLNAWDRETRPIALSPSFFHTDIMPVVNQQGVQINPPRRTRGGRVRALDVDAGGRRGGGPESDNGYGAQDDELPAYEAGKGPPGYHIATLELLPLPSQNVPQAHPSPISSDNTMQIPRTNAPDSSADVGDRLPSISLP